MRQQPPRSILDTFQKSGIPWQAVEREAVYSLISAAVELGREFTQGMALADLHYWIHRQDVKPVRYYAARWGWGKNRVHRLMLSIGIEETAEEGRDNAGQERDNAGQNRQESDKKTKVSGQHRDNAGQGRDSINDPRSYDPRSEDLGVSQVPEDGPPEDGRTDEPKKPTPAAEKTPSRKPKGDPRPENVQQVIALFEQRRYIGGAEEAEAFFAFFESNGWVIGKAKAPCKDWRQAAVTWNFLNKKRNGNGNGSHPQSPARPAGKPGRSPVQSSYERRMSLTVEQVARDRAERLRRRGIRTGDDPGVPDGTGRDPDIEGRVPVDGSRGAAGGRGGL